MLNLLRKSLHRFVPSHFHNPLGLVMRLLRTGDAVALFAMKTALLGMLLTPLDLMLQIAEKRLYKRASEPRLPLIFLVGPPRTGTTLVSQVLIQNLSVCYFNNLTAVLPRSPIVANRLFGKIIGQKEIRYRSYYGKSLHFSGPNDGLYIWDRWFGKDRKQLPSALSETKRSEMIQFFGAYQEAFGKPLINKHNSLNTYAHLVADVFENAYFLCMTREPVYLAQSLLKARIDIHGDAHTWYGVEDPQKSARQDADYIEDVCEQVLFHQRKIQEQQNLIGPERFWTVSYESFCENPVDLVHRVSERILKQPVQMEALKENLKPFDIANTVKIEPKLFKRIEQVLSHQKGKGNGSQVSTL